jgi:hypothetical protein
MKVGGKDVKEMRHKDCVVFRRGDDQIVFWAEPLVDYSEFNKLCPEPTPPVVMTPKGRELDIENVDYLKLVNSYSAKKIAFLIIHSLKPSDIEWETVKYGDSETWLNWEKDLQNNNFSPMEIQHIGNLVFDVNSLDESKLKAARENFLHGPLAV